MKKSILFALPFLTASLFGQITVTNSTFPAVGDTLHFLTDPAPPVLSLGTAGAGNQFWDFSNLDGQQNQTEIYFSAASGSGGPNFLTADLRTEGPTGETFWRKTAAVVERLGSSGADPLNLGLDLALRQQPPLAERRAPMHFFDIHQVESDLTWAVSTDLLADSLLGQLAALVDSFRFRIRTERLDVVDAWGECKIPGGTFPVLREKRTETTKTSIDIHSILGWTDIGSLFGGGGSGLLGSVGTDTTVRFHFFSATEKEAIAVLTMNSDGSNLRSARFKKLPATTATDDFSDEKAAFSLAPNPAFSTVFLGMEKPKTGFSFLKIMDATGRLLFSKAFENEKAALEIDLAEWPSGLHFVQILDEKGQIVGSKKLLKN